MNRTPDSSWFSDYYYDKLVYQDVNMRSYFASIRPPTANTNGFRLARCVILHFPKRTSIQLFLPRRPPRRVNERSKAAKKKGRWWALRKVRPISIGKGGGEGERVHQSKQIEEVRIWPKKKQRSYGYHDRSPSSIKKKLSKLLGVMRPSSKRSGVANDLTFLIEHDISFRQTKLFKFFFPNKSHASLASQSQKILPAPVPSSLDYTVMQYLLHTKNQIPFDPIRFLNHFVARPVTAQPSFKGTNDLDGKRIRSLIAFFVENSTSEKNRLTHLISQANGLRLSAGATTTKPTISPTFFFPKDGLGVYNKPSFEDAREQLLSQLRTKCWNLMGKSEVMELVDKFTQQGENGIHELIEAVEMMTMIILKNRRIPYGYNTYLNEVAKMRSFLSDRTHTNTILESVKVKSNYQSASLIAQDIALQMKKKSRSFPSIFNQIVRDMPKGVQGIRVCASGRIGGAEIAKVECAKFGKTSRNVFNQKVDYAFAEAATRYGTTGVKVWISYSKKKEMN